MEHFLEWSGEMETTSMLETLQKQEVKQSIPGIIEERLLRERLTFKILACAIDVHRDLGPGLLENAYRVCFVERLRKEGLSVRQEVPISIKYKDLVIDVAFRADVIVEDSVLLELKAVDELLPVHGAQVLTYLKFMGMRVGLLLNFNAKNLMKSMRRYVR
jgi:GxxExxY protein